MPKNAVVVRTASDLEKKYNLGSLGVLKKNIEKTSQGMQKIENELNSMLNTLVINLKDVLDNQSEITLWFYSGTPTLENEPYISWETPSEHVGDIYYDQKSGKVYQFNNASIWEVNVSPDLIEAMAITNSEIDVTDHERKVFFVTPVVPYSNGDWWIKEDGTLYICQISKSTGTYEDNDFVNSSNYTESIAEKIGEELKVLKGTITIISESYAKFTDLATGGSTIINGDNITTGSLKSQNYMENVSGMKILLETGVIDSKNFKTDTEGNVYLGDGAKIIGGDGLLTNLEFVSSGKYQCYDLLGFDAATSGGTGATYLKKDISIEVDIPSNFTVVSAYLTLYHTPIHWGYTGAEAENLYTDGYARNLKIYKANSDSTNYNFFMMYFSEPTISSDNLSLTEVTNAFGSSTYTPSNTSGNSIEAKRSIDIKNFINSSGKHKLVVRTNDSVPTDAATACAKTGMARAIVTVIGYMSF